MRARLCQVLASIQVGSKERTRGRVPLTVSTCLTDRWPSVCGRQPQRGRSKKTISFLAYSILIQRAVYSKSNPEYCKMIFVEFSRVLHPGILHFVQALITTLSPLLQLHVKRLWDSHIIMTGSVHMQGISGAGIRSRGDCMCWSMADRHLSKYVS